MEAEEALIRQIHAAFEVEPRINRPGLALRLESEGERLALRGEVTNLAAKRLAVCIAEQLAGPERVVDELRIPASEPRADGEILAVFTEMLLGHIDLRNCTLIRRLRGRQEVMREILADDRSGEVAFSTQDGAITLDGWVISLSHQRVAEVLAWWVPGCRNVCNRLAVLPAEQDNDDELSDAVHLALEMDPLVHADQIGVSTSLGAVTLLGAVAGSEERDMAEFDTWCVAGTREVINRLQIPA